MFPGFKEDELYNCLTGDMNTVGINASHYQRHVKSLFVPVCKLVMSKNYLATWGKPSPR